MESCNTCWFRCLYCDRPPIPDKPGSMPARSELLTATSTMMAEAKATMSTPAAQPASTHGQFLTFPDLSLLIAYLCLTFSMLKISSFSSFQEECRYYCHQAKDTCGKKDGCVNFMR